MIPYWMKCQVFLVISLRVGFINYVIICSRDGLVWPLGSEKNRRGHFLLTSFFCFKVAILFELSTLEDILLCNFYKNNKAKVTTEKIERKIWKCCLSFFLIMPVTRETDRAQGSQCESLRDTVESKYMGLTCSQWKVSHSKMRPEVFRCLVQGTPWFLPKDSSILETRSTGHTGCRWQT